MTRHMHIVLVGIAWVLAIVSSGAAQTPANPAFEVVSIRRSASPEGGGGSAQGNRYSVRNQTAMGVLMGAYLLPPERIIGGPDWITTERYDIIAQAARDFAPGELQAMLRGMLRDRFNFAGRVETRDVPAFALVLARTDGRLGPGLRRAPVDCRDAEAVKKARASSDGKEPICTGQANSTNIRFRGLSLNALATALAGPAGRLVVNRTGLTGLFDIDLEWVAVNSQDGVSIFTAVQEQLGLKLESTTAPFEVLVIDRIERPTEN